MVSCVKLADMNTIRVLLVDDATRVRDDLRTLLTLSGAIEIVGEAENGLEAIQQFEALLPEAVLMDLEMPEMNGYEAIRWIKTHEPDCRVIALTVHDYEEAQKQAKEAGADAFVVKGAPLETILQEIFKGQEAD